MTSEEQQFVNNQIRAKTMSDIHNDDQLQLDRINKLSLFDYNKFNRLCKLVTQFIKSRSDLDIRDLDNRVGFCQTFGDSHNNSVINDLNEICELFNYLSGDAKQLFIRRICLLLSSYHYIGYHARVRTQRRLNQFLELLKMFDKHITNQISEDSDHFVRSSCIPLPVLEILPVRQNLQPQDKVVKEDTPQQPNCDKTQELD